MHSYTKLDYTHLYLALSTQPWWEWRMITVELDFTMFSEDGRLETISKEFFQGDLLTRFKDVALYPLSYFMDVG